MMLLFLLSIIQCFHFEQLHAFTQQELYECKDFDGDFAASKASQIMTMPTEDRSVLKYLFDWCDKTASEAIDSSIAPILERAYNADEDRQMPQFAIGYHAPTKSLVIYIEGTDFGNKYDTTNLITADLEYVEISLSKSKEDHSDPYFRMSVHRGINNAINTPLFTSTFGAKLASVLQQIHKSDTALVEFSGTLLIDHVYITGHSQGGAIAQMIYAQFVGGVFNDFNFGLWKASTNWFDDSNFNKFFKLIANAKVMTFGAATWLYHTDEVVLRGTKTGPIAQFYAKLNSHIFNYFVKEEPAPLLFSGIVETDPAHEWFVKHPFTYSGFLESVYYMYGSYNKFASFAPIGRYVLILNNKFYEFTNEDIRLHISRGAEMCEDKSSESFWLLKAKLLLDITNNHRMSNYITKTKAAIAAQHSGFVINLLIFGTIGLFIIGIVVFVCFIMFVCGVYSGSFVATFNKNKNTKTSVLK